MKPAKITKKIKSVIATHPYDNTGKTALALCSALFCGVALIAVGCVGDFAAAHTLPTGTKIIFTSPALANEFRAAANLETNRTGAVVELPAPATLTMNHRSP